VIVAYRGRDGPRHPGGFLPEGTPFGPGWKRVRIEAGISEAEAAALNRGENIPLALTGWAAGTTVIWSSLFTVGIFSTPHGVRCYPAGGVRIGTAVLIWVIRRLWASSQTGRHNGASSTRGMEDSPVKELNSPSSSLARSRKRRYPVTDTPSAAEIRISTEHFRLLRLWRLAVYGF